MNASPRHAQSLLTRLAVYIPVVFIALNLMPSFRAGLARVVHQNSIVFSVVAVPAVVFVSYLLIQKYRATRRTWDLVEALAMPALVVMSVVVVVFAMSRVP